jgi:opacity protein-like surface antigen
MRIRFLGVMLLLLLSAPMASAQMMWEVQPFVGYTFGGAVNLGPNSQNILRATFDPSPAYGASVLFNGRPNWGLEFLWHRQTTTAVSEIDETATFPQTIDVNIDQYQGNVIITLADEEDQVKPFILAGMGLTKARGAGDNITKFSVGVGGGLRYFFSRHMGIRMQARWSPTRMSPSGSMFCNWWGFCWSIANAHFLHQGDATAGLIFRF